MIRKGDKPHFAGRNGAYPLFDPQAALTETDRVIIEALLTHEAAMSRHHQWVYELIAPWLGESLLEVGSGVGVMSRYLVMRRGRIVLSDHHPAYLAHLRARFGDRAGVALQILDLRHPPYDVPSPVDTIVCLNVLEHVEDDSGALRALARLLPARGRLVLKVPNCPALFGSLDESYGHFRRYSQRSIAACLTDAGFRILWLRNFNPLAVPGWLLAARVRRARRIEEPWARLFNAIVPLARRLDFLARFGGLALLACAERRGDPTA